MNNLNSRKGNRNDSVDSKDQKIDFSAEIRSLYQEYSNSQMEHIRANTEGSQTIVSLEIKKEYPEDADFIRIVPTAKRLRALFNLKMECKENRRALIVNRATEVTTWLCHFCVFPAFDGFYSRYLEDVDEQILPNGEIGLALEKEATITKNDLTEEDIAVGVSLILIFMNKHSISNKQLDSFIEKKIAVLKSKLNLTDTCLFYHPTFLQSISMVLNCLPKLRNILFEFCYKYPVTNTLFEEVISFWSKSLSTAIYIMLTFITNPDKTYAHYLLEVMCETRRFVSFLGVTKMELKSDWIYYKSLYSNNYAIDIIEHFPNLLTAAFYNYKDRFYPNPYENYAIKKNLATVANLKTLATEIMDENFYVDSNETINLANTLYTSINNEDRENNFIDFDDLDFLEEL